MKNIHTNASSDFTIDTTNYTVPHDFDYSSYSWIEFLTENERNICVYSFETNKKWFHQIDKNFGHISHLKLLPNNKLFLVRNLNRCEIREINQDFKLVHSFTHIGDEVIAVDVYINSSKVLLNEMELQNINIKNKISYNSEDFLKIPIKKNNQFHGNDPNDDAKIQVDDNNVSIVLLDIDGNVNVWENLILIKKFNLYDIREIDQEYKDKQFFSMGYPYHIKANQNYFVISSDHGVFVMTHRN